MEGFVEAAARMRTRCDAASAASRRSFSAPASAPTRSSTSISGAERAAGAGSAPRTSVADDVRRRSPADFGDCADVRTSTMGCSDERASPGVSDDFVGLESAEDGVTVSGLSAWREASAWAAIFASETMEKEGRVPRPTDPEERMDGAMMALGVLFWSKEGCARGAKGEEQSGGPPSCRVRAKFWKLSVSPFCFLVRFPRAFSQRVDCSSVKCALAAFPRPETAQGGPGSANRGASQSSNFLTADDKMFHFPHSPPREPPWSMRDRGWRKSGKANPGGPCSGGFTRAMHAKIQDLETHACECL